MWGDGIKLFTNTVVLNIGLADAVGELPYFPEKNMHQKIIYTPQFYCLKNSLASPLSSSSSQKALLPRRSPLSFCLGASTVQVAEQSGHTSDTKQYATGSQERVCKGSTGRDRARTSRRRARVNSQEVRGTSWRHSLPAQAKRLLRMPRCSGKGTETFPCSQSTSSGPPFLSR